MTPAKLAQYTALLVQRAGRSLGEAQDNYHAGSYNVAASQAYYSMYDAAKSLLATRMLGALDETDAGLVQAFAQHFIMTGDIEPEWQGRFEKALRTRLSCGYDSRYNATRDEAEEVLAGAEDFITLVKRQLELELKRLELPDLRMGRASQSDENAQNSGSPG